MLFLRAAVRARQNKYLKKAHGRAMALLADRSVQVRVTIWLP
jgi:hypothetical protein